MSARSARRWIVRGVIAVALFYTPIASVNPASRLALIDSLLERGTPATEGSRFFNRLDMVQYGDHFYSDKPPLLGLYSTAVLAPVHGPLTFDGGVAGRILYWLVVASASGLALLVLVLAARSLYRRAGGPVPWPWLAGGMLAATCVFPFARTYNDHILEAAALLAAYALLRRAGPAPRLGQPLAVGALVGVTWLLHPLVGTVAALTTGSYYLLRTAGGPLGRRVTLAAVFSAAALGTLALGSAIHVGLYGRAAPFYFSPELYLWTGGPGGVESHWLTEPTVPGLTAERISARFEELGLPAERLAATLGSYEAHVASVRNPISFAARRWFRYGQLTFNPLVLFCLVLAVASVRSRGADRAETAWILATTLGLVAASVWLRAVPGGSFGDRHLLPAVPLLIVAGGLAATSKREDGLFRGLALLSATMVLPGAMAPWVTPGGAFLGVNLAVSVAAVVGALIVWRSAESSAVARAWEGVQAFVAGRRLPVAVAVAAVAQLTLYLVTLPTG